MKWVQCLVCIPVALGWGCGPGEMSEDDACDLIAKIKLPKLNGHEQEGFPRGCSNVTVSRGISGDIDSYSLRAHFDVYGRASGTMYYDCVVMGWDQAYCKTPQPDRARELVPKSASWW